MVYTWGKVHKRNSLDNQNRVDTALIFRIVCHLRVFAPYNFSAGSHQTQFAHIHLKAQIEIVISGP